MEPRAAVEAYPYWYHTLELAPGVVTPGRVDLRPIVDRLPWPEVEGRRCLDVGTCDGFYAFELERRGAAEVVATDIRDRSSWDWPPMEEGERAPFFRSETGRGFRLAHEVLGSSVRREEINVYDLSHDRLGEFDVVICGGLLHHVRDPIRALEAIRGVCGGHLLSVDLVAVGLTFIHRRRAVAEFSGDEGLWWIPSAPGHRRMLEVAGFAVERATRPIALRYGAAHPARHHGKKGHFAMRLVRRLPARGPGPPYAAILARPRI
jgi:tRNA (mo5U34)-methyltransferase